MKRRTKEEMVSLINKWRSSKTSKQVFCSEHRIKVGVFYYWLSKLEKEEGEKKKQGKFLSVEVTENSLPGKTGLVEVHFPNGVRLVLHDLQDLSVLAQLIKGA